MRAKIMLQLVCAAVLLTSPALFAADHEADAYPIEFALLKTASGQQSFVKFPEGLSLYVYNKDSKGKSNCGHGCDGAYPPVSAPKDAVSMGHWAPIDRYDGSKQWTYRGRPVYLYFHDKPGDPQGAANEGWSLLQP